MTTPKRQGDDTDASATEPQPVFLGGDPDEFPDGKMPEDLQTVVPDDEPSDPPAADDEPGDDDDADSFEWPEGVEVPEALKNKSPAEVFEAYKNLDTLRGQLASELGESRQLLRDAVAANLMVPKNREPAPDDLADLDPEEREVQERVEKAVARALEPVQKNLDQQQLISEVRTLETKYPKFQETVQSPEFKAWVGGSEYRISMYNRANKYDFKAADELLSGWTELQAAKQAAAAATATTANVRSKATVTGGSGGKSPSKKGPIYRAIDIQRMYLTDREQYVARQEEFAKAFEEGRVK